MKYYRSLEAVCAVMAWTALALLLSVSRRHGVEATKMEFYGSPNVYRTGEEILLKFNKLYSRTTLLPIDPYTSQLGLCEPEFKVRDAENLGELLQGDRVQRSPYRIWMKQDMYCEPLCMSNLGGDNDNPMAEAIRKEYTQNWLLDNLPAASKAEDDQYIVTRYWQGIPLGYVADDTDQPPILYNHVNIEVLYQRWSNRKKEEYLVTRFVVEPFSIRHDADSYPNITTPIPPCLQKNKAEKRHTNYDSVMATTTVQPATGPVIFTYDVTWIEYADLPWSARWDIYLQMDNAVPDAVHWMSIANSAVVVLVFACIILMIWRRNIAGYQRIQSSDETPSPQPWHYIKNDVFRAPSMPLLLAINCGTGAHLTVTAFIVTGFAMSGLTNQSHPGALLQSYLLVYCMTGVVNGYISVYYYKAFNGKRSWRTVSILAATGFSGLLGMVFVWLQTVFVAHHSSSAVPLSTFVVLLVLWGTILLPLTLLGGWLGRRSPPIRFPTKVNETARIVPPLKVHDLCWASLYILVCGSYTFGSIFVESYYLLASAWMEYFYNSFFFLALVLLVAVITCSASSVLFIYYFAFRKQNYNWWWKSFLFGCITGVLSFLYAISYFAGSVGFSFLPAMMVYFGYMSITSLALALALGFVALSSTLWFSKWLYGVFADDSADDNIEMNTAPTSSLPRQPSTLGATSIPVDAEPPISSSASDGR